MKSKDNRYKDLSSKGKMDNQARWKAVAGKRPDVSKSSRRPSPRGR